jgi:hypothetical protein
MNALPNESTVCGLSGYGGNAVGDVSSVLVKYDGEKDDRRTSTITPRGDRNAKLFRKAWVGYRRAMRSL